MNNVIQIGGKCHWNEQQEAFSNIGDIILREVVIGCGEGELLGITLVFNYGYQIHGEEEKEKRKQNAEEKRKRNQGEKINEKRKQNAEEEKERKQEDDDDKIEVIIYYKNYNIS